MFEKLVKEKINSEKSKIRLLNPVSKESVRKSELEVFTKNFIFNETPEITESEYLDELIEKSVKLQFNFTLRPKWTLLNYIYGGIDSKSDGEIRHKLKIFTFYRFYPDTILNYLNEERHLYVSRSKIDLLLKDTNEVLYNKLTNDITGVKIKNFLINVFKLKYEDESKINLESAVPFSFIKIFLEDKEYTDLLEKFNIIPDLKEHTLVSYKDIIKVLTDKYTALESAKIEYKSESKIIDITDKQRAKDLQKDLPKEIKNQELKAETHDDVFEIKKTEEETIESKIEIDIPPVVEQKAEAKHDPNKKKGNKKEVNYTKFDIYSDDLKKEQEEKDKEAEEKRKEEDKEIFSEVEKEPADIYEISRLFTSREIGSVIEKIYKSNKMEMRSSFRALSKMKSWKDATKHIKNLFNDNKVNIYSKTTVMYTDVMQEYFINKEKEKK